MGLNVTRGDRGNIEVSRANSLRACSTACESEASHEHGHQGSDHDKSPHVNPPASVCLWGVRIVSLGVEAVNLPAAHECESRDKVRDAIHQLVGRPSDVEAEDADVLDVTDESDEAA
jgi:hypothetical protein